MLVSFFAIRHRTLLHFPWPLCMVRLSFSFHLHAKFSACVCFLVIWHNEKKIVSNSTTDWKDRGPSQRTLSRRGRERRNQRKKKSNFLLVDSFTTFFDWQKDVLTQLRRKVTYNLIPMLRRLPSSPWHIQTQQQALLETHIKSSTVDRQRQVKATHKEYGCIDVDISCCVM